MINIKNLVHDYIRYFRKNQLDELSFYQAQIHKPKEFCHLIAWAITPAGKTHSHQCRIERDTKSYLEEYLYKNFAKFQSANNFDEIQRLLKGIYGIGPLTIYDTALRIGACLNISPQKVYLHSGTRKGALELLGDKAKWKQTLDMKEFPVELQKLTPSEVEDFLCIYKDTFKTGKLPYRSCHIKKTKAC